MRDHQLCRTVNWQEKFLAKNPEPPPRPIGRDGEEFFRVDFGPQTSQSLRLELLMGNFGFGLRTSKNLSCIAEYFQRVRPLNDGTSAHAFCEPMIIPCSTLKPCLSISSSSLKSVLHLLQYKFIHSPFTLLCL